MTLGKLVARLLDVLTRHRRKLEYEMLRAATRRRVPRRRLIKGRIIEREVATRAFQESLGMDIPGTCQMFLVVEIDRRL